MIFWRSVMIGTVLTVAGTAGASGHLLDRQARTACADLTAAVNGNSRAGQRLVRDLKPLVGSRYSTLAVHAQTAGGHNDPIAAILVSQQCAAAMRQ